MDDWRGFGEITRNRVEMIGKEALMESNNNTKSPGPKRDAAALELLRKLREKLFSRDISSARLAAHNLSWMQEDGLAILKEALFGDYPGTSKKAAAYGLRSMKGRMKKLALEVIEQGLNHRDRVTQQVCAKCLFLSKGGTPPPTHNRRGQGHGNRVIRDLPNKRRNGAPHSIDRQ
jgi:hypothetical protein